MFRWQGHHHSHNHSLWPCHLNIFCYLLNFIRSLVFISCHQCLFLLHHFRFWGWVLHMLCLLGPLWSVYKGFFKIPLFSSSSVFLMVLNPPSGVENLNVKNSPMSYIKSCILTCTFRIWTSFVVLPKQKAVKEDFFLAASSSVHSILMIQCV